MVGFLAPQINDIGSAPAGGGGVVDTSIADALTNVGNIFNAGLRAGGNANVKSPTQKDRDNETLRPFNEEVARLQNLRPEIGEAQFNNRLNSAFSSFVVGNGTLVGDARATVLAITGTEVGDEDFNVINVLEQNNKDFLETNRGKAELAGLLQGSKNPETGEFDPDLVFANVTRAAASAAADAAELDALKLLQEKEAATVGINEGRLRGVVDDQLAKFGVKASASMQGIIAVGLQTDARIEDASIFLRDIRLQRTLLKDEIESDARRGGFANHPDFDVNIALAPFDNAIATIESLGDDTIKAFEVLRAADEATSINIINSTVGGGGSNRIFQDFFWQGVLSDTNVDLSEAAQGLNPTEMREARRGAPLFTGTAIPVTSDNPPSVTPVVTDEATVVARSLSEPQRQDEVKVNLATFGQYIPEHSGNENFRAVATESFGMASAAMNTSIKPVSEATFDKTYDGHFFGAYNNIVSFGDSTSANLQNSVTSNLATIFEQRKNLANVRLSNNFSNAFPGIGLSFDSKGVVVDLGEARDQNARFLFDSLKRAGLPKTLEGARRLAILEPNNPAFLPFSEARGVNDIFAEVDYLNKIISTVNKLEDLSPHILPRIEESINGNSPASIPLISSEEELLSLGLSKGDLFSYLDSDGNLVTEPF